MSDFSGAIIEQIRSSIKEANSLLRLVIDEHQKSEFQGYSIKWNKCQVRFERWYRITRKIFERISFSGFEEFEEVMIGGVFDSESGGPTGGMKYFFEGSIPSKESVKDFVLEIAKCLALMEGAIAETETNVPGIRTQLSYEFIADEYEQAELLYKLDFHRAAGVIAGIALERHVKTLCESHSIEVEKNPPDKSKASFSDYIMTLKKAEIINEVKRKEFEYLYGIRSTCSHPDEVNKDDIKRLLLRGKEIAVL